VDGPSLLSESHDQRVPIEVYGYLMDNAGDVVRHVSEGIQLEPDGHINPVARAGLRFVGQLELSPGLYSLRVMIRNHANGRYLLARKELQIPESDSGQPYLLPPMMSATPVNGLLLAGQRGLDIPAIANALTGLDGWPTARPVLPVAQPVEMILGCSELSEALTAQIRLVNAVGRTIQRPKLRVGEPLAQLGSLMFYRASTAAIDVPGGHYRMVVELADANTGRTVSKSLPIYVRSEGSVPSWADRSTIARPVAKPQVTKKRVRDRAITNAYHKALGLMATGSSLEARRALAELERRAYATTSARSRIQLRAVEGQSALLIAREQPASLMAVTLLHRDMYHWYAARYESELSEHSWATAAAMAEQTLKIPGWEPLDGFVECLLLDLASDLARRGDVRRAQMLLERAAKLEPKNAPVLFGLGLVHEFAGEPIEATEYLQKLVNVRPDQYEAKLRLAINRERTGADRKARELMRDLLVEPAPEWIQTIAYQQLAQMLIADDRIEEAEELLREGAIRLPDNQRLQILLAYVLDRKQRPWDATAVIEALEARGSQLSTSPRVRYAEWPPLEPDRVRSTLDEARTAGLEALREVMP
jgi:tetratricopeptide (TPR) repeat protein